VEKCISTTSSTYPVSIGYDRIRFLKPVFIGDTITVTYVMTAYDEARSRSSATIEITKGGNEVVASAIHLMKWLNK
jgi:acyl dehydratase